MGRPARIHTDKAPNRLHYIVEWAEHRGYTQADLARELGVDKSSVSRWFGGQLPTEKHLSGIADLFKTDIISLFRPPHEDWLWRFFQGRQPDEITRIRNILVNTFPDAAA